MLSLKLNIPHFYPLLLCIHIPVTCRTIHHEMVNADGLQGARCADGGGPGANVAGLDYGGLLSGNAGDVDFDCGWSAWGDGAAALGPLDEAGYCWRGRAGYAEMGRWLRGWVWLDWDWQ